jgi:hypothetical protein
MRNNIGFYSVFSVAHSLNWCQKIKILKYIKVSSLIESYQRNVSKEYSNPTFLSRSWAPASPSTHCPPEGSLTSLLHPRNSHDQYDRMKRRMGSHECVRD